MPNGASFARTVKRAVPGRDAGFTDSVAKAGTCDAIYLFFNSLGFRKATDLQNYRFCAK
jgi:hypothetical protein